MEKESGFEGVRKPCGIPVLIWVLFEGPVTFTPNCGETPAAAVTETWIVAFDAGVSVTEGGDI